MSASPRLSSDQFRALTAYIQAAINVAVATAAYQQRELCHSDMGAYYEEQRLREAEAALFVELVGTE